MKLELIKKSIEQSIQTETNETVKNELLKTLSEINDQIERYESRDLFDDEIYLITPESITDLLNIVTYDELGKLLKKSDDIKVEQYEDLIKSKFQIYELNKTVLTTGLEIISDLWYENDEYGNHNDDGTFCGE